MTKFQSQFNNDTIQLYAGYNSLSGNGSAPISNAQNISCETMTFDQGDLIYKAGDPVGGIYILKTGCVKIYVNRESARGRTTTQEYVTKLVSPNEVFGYTPVVQRENLNCYAEAIKVSTVDFYSIKAVEQMMRGLNPFLTMVLNQSISDLQHVEKISQFHYLASVKERIAYQLVTMADRFGVKTDRGVSLNLKLTRNEFAQLASTINESLSRHLTEFKNEGLIDIHGKEIIILNREALVAKSGNLQI